SGPGRAAECPRPFSAFRAPQQNFELLTLEGIDAADQYALSRIIEQIDLMGLLGSVEFEFAFCGLITQVPNQLGAFESPVESIFEAFELALRFSNALFFDQNKSPGALDSLRVFSGHVLPPAVRGDEAENDQTE